MSRAWEARRVRFAGRPSGPARRCLGRSGAGVRCPWLGRAGRRVGAVGASLQLRPARAGAHPGGRRARRGPQGLSPSCRSRASVLLDRAETSGSAPLMPRRGPAGRWKGSRVEQRARGPRLGCTREPGPGLGSAHHSSAAHPAFCKRLGVAGAGAGRGLLYSASAASLRVPPCLLPCARPVLSSCERNLQPRRSQISPISKRTSHPGFQRPDGGVSPFSLGDRN